NDVLLKKNEAVLRKAEATDEWNHYQSVSTKMHLIELARELVPAERAAALDEKLQKYTVQRDELTAKAHALDEASARADQEAEELSRPHLRLGMAFLFMQISISIASITALTQQRWLFAVALLSAASGALLCASALLMGG